VITVTLVLPKGLKKAEVAEYRSQVLFTVMGAAHAEIARLVQQNLHSLRSAYMQALNLSSPADIKENGKAVIELIGALPNMIEQGASSWDLRTTLLDKNPKKKTGKDGTTYASIPFRHTTPGSHGAMPENVYNEAKKLTPTLTSAKAAKTQWGGSLQSGLAPKQKAHHTTDIYTGMYRYAKTYKAKKGGQYKSFRTISSRTSVDPNATGNRNPASWIHPGFVARNFIGLTRTFIEQHAEGIVASVPIPSPVMGKVVVSG